MSVPPCKRADEAHRRAEQLVGTIHDALAAHLVRAGLTVPVPTEQRNSIRGMLELLVTHTRTHCAQLLDLVSDALVQTRSTTHPRGTLAPVQLSESVHVAWSLSKQPRW